jgi:serine phosphatase RsbU (regulator of sigma subunit)
MAALALYEYWGGTYPLSGFGLRSLLPGFGATGAWWLFSTLVWVPIVVYFSSFWRPADVRLGVNVRYWASAMGWQALATPFAILAAILYAQNGLVAFLFWVAGLLLASFLAHRLSREAERSRQSARELAILEGLGRAIIDAGCCTFSSDLPTSLSAVLEEHVSSMFPYSHLEIRLFPDQTLLRHAQDDPVHDAWNWDWLGRAGEARYMAAGSPPPWGGPPLGAALAAAPILDTESGATIGGIYLSRNRDPAMLAVGDLPAGELPALQSLAAQVASALNSARVYQQRLAHQRVEQELALAGQIQASFLSDQLPHIPGWQLAVRLEPARETSGDFYDVIPLPDGRFGLVVADVADKGMGAALYMALSRTLIRTYATEYPDQPESVLGAANRRILMDTRASMFVTVFYLVLDPVTGLVSYCNAGHNPPYLLHSQNPGEMQLLTKTGMALGVIKDTVWKSAQVSLAEGDTIVLYTDGITEAQNEAGEFFGEERLLAAVQDCIGYPAAEMEEALLTELDDFAGSAARFDDITLMVLSRR